jgi:Putative zinc- or iron-chelating domain
MPSQGQNHAPNLARDFRREVAEGLLYTHSRLNTNTSKTMEASSFLYALIELLSEKGFITVEELDARKRVVGQRLAKQFSGKGMGVMLQDPEYDKYTFQGGVEIDCANRVHLCKASCCRLPFALSKQDVREGIVYWNLGQPYLIDQGKDGYCVHLQRGSCQCGIYAHRPVPCRGYDCRNDKRIWLDFEKKLPNPALGQPDWPQCLTPGAGQGGAP